MLIIKKHSNMIQTERNSCFPLKPWQEKLSIKHDTVKTNKHTIAYTKHSQYNNSINSVHTPPDGMHLQLFYNIYTIFEEIILIYHMDCSCPRFLPSLPVKISFRYDQYHCTVQYQHVSPPTRFGKSMHFLYECIQYSFEYCFQLSKGTITLTDTDWLWLWMTTCDLVAVYCIPLKVLSLESVKNREQYIQYCISLRV